MPSGQVMAKCCSALKVGWHLLRGLFSSAEVQRLLGLSSRFEVARFLKEAGVPLAYDESDVEADRQTWDERLTVG